MESPDLTFIRSGEFDVTQIQGISDAGIDFVDRWLQREMIVVDLGRIIVRDLTRFEKAAIREGLVAAREVVA